MNGLDSLADFCGCLQIDSTPIDEREEQCSPSRKAKESKLAIENIYGLPKLQKPARSISAPTRGQPTQRRTVKPPSPIVPAQPLQVGMTLLDESHFQPPPLPQSNQLLGSMLRFDISYDGMPLFTPNELQYFLTGLGEVPIGLPQQYPPFHPQTTVPSQLAFNCVCEDEQCQQEYFQQSAWLSAHHYALQFPTQMTQNYTQFNHTPQRQPPTNIPPTSPSSIPQTFYINTQPPFL